MKSVRMNRIDIKEEEEEKKKSALNTDDHVFSVSYSSKTVCKPFVYALTRSRLGKNATGDILNDFFFF